MAALLARVVELCIPCGWHLQSSMSLGADFLSSTGLLMELCH